MKSTAPKFPSRKTTLPGTLRRWNPTSRFALWTGLLLAALYGLAVSSAFAAFWDVQVSPWNGGKDHYCGDTLIKSGTLNHSGAMTAAFSSLPANTGPMEYWGNSRSGDYWYGVGVLAKGDTGIVIDNDSGGIIQSIITANTPAQAAGIYALQDIHLNNSGTCDGQLRNKDGWAAGVCVQGAATIDNKAGATCSATANFATGIKANGGRLNVVNYGTIKATASGGTQTAHAHADGVDLFSYDGKHNAPIYFENNGSVIAAADSTGCDTNRARSVNIWAEQSSATFKNTGTLAATATGARGEADGVYCGADNGDVTFYNSGTISNTGSGGFCVGLENDSDTGNMYIDNSGTITTSNPFAIMLGNYKGDLKSCGHCYFKNTGTIKGGWLGLSWPAIGGMTFYDSGDIRTTLCWLGGNVDAYICGLPTIDPELTPDTSGHRNTLVFNLNGTLEKINGKSVADTGFSGLSSQGSIVVSGKTYRWKNFQSVSGTVFPGNKCGAAGIYKRREDRPFALSRGNTGISFFLPRKTASLLIKIYDVKGVLVSRIANKDLPAGRNSFPSALANVSPGGYMCEIVLDGKKYSAAMSVVR